MEFDGGVPIRKQEALLDSFKERKERNNTKRKKKEIIINVCDLSNILCIPDMYLGV